MKALGKEKRRGVNQKFKPGREVKEL